MNPPGTVLVTGGTGTTGSRVAQGLREEGAAVRIATRKPDGGDPEQVRFDWADPSTHAPALAGIEGVYLVAPVGVAAPEPMVEPFLDQALAAGVRRVVLLSSSAVAEGDPGLGALHRRVRQTMPEWAVLRPSWFMWNFVGDHPVAVGIRTGGEIVTATGRGRVGFVDVADIAAVAVRALTDAVSHDTAHVLTGPEALDYADAAAIVSQATGRQVRHRSVDATELASRLAAGGVPEGFAALLAGLDRDISEGTQERVTTTVADITGRPARSFAEFVQEHRDLF